MNTPSSDPQAVRAIADTVFVVTRDTLTISRLDTLLVDRTPGPSPWWSIATLLAVPMGWFLVDLLSRRAQKDHYRDRVILDAARSVSDDLLRFTRWLVDRSEIVEKFNTLPFEESAKENEHIVRMLENHRHKSESLDFGFSITANERMLRPMVPWLHAELVRLLDRQTDAEVLVDRAANDPSIDSVVAAAFQLGELAHDVERVRDRMMTAVTEQVLGRPSWWHFRYRTNVNVAESTVKSESTVPAAPASDDD